MLLASVSTSAIIALMMTPVDILTFNYCGTKFFGKSNALKNVKIKTVLKELMKVERKGMLYGIVAGATFIKYLLSLTVINSVERYYMQRFKFEE